MPTSARSDSPDGGGAAPPSPRIRLGCQGWAYPDWLGVFYPPGSKQEHLLPFYAQVFDTVELDNTFYRAPKASIVRSWARHTPDDFVFTAKVPREITHESGLKGVDDAMQHFLRSLEPLGDKLGPVLLQLPASFERDEETHRDLVRFLDALPRGTRLAFEVRHESWQTEAVYELLREHQVSWTWIDWRRLPVARVVTAPYLYLRWLGNRADIEKYDRIQIDRTDVLDDWAAAIRETAPQVESMYGYFNNHWAGHSPASVRDLLRRLGRPFTDPQNLWPQRELF